MEETNTTTAVETQQTENQKPAEQAESVQSQEEANTETATETTVQEETQHAEVNVETEEAVKQTLTEKGLDFDALAKEYEENGNLSDDTMKKLEEAGFPKPMVDMYIAGLEAKAEAFTQAVYNVAGGKDKFDTLSQYLQQQPKETIEAFNKVLMTGDIGQIGLVVQGVQAQMKTKYGTTNPTIMSGQTGVSGKEGFKTKTEMVEAMKDPRYQKDVAYTQEVYERIKKATYKR